MCAPLITRTRRRLAFVWAVDAQPRELLRCKAPALLVASWTFVGFTRRAMVVLTSVAGVSHAGYPRLADTAPVDRRPDTDPFASGPAAIALRMSSRAGPATIVSCASSSTTRRTSGPPRLPGARPSRGSSGERTARQPHATRQCLWLRPRCLLLQPCCSHCRP